MTEFKIVINDTKTGKSYLKTVDDDSFIGLKLGSKVKGEVLGLEGYELEVAGGSDSAGFPMVKKLDTTERKRVLLTSGPGVHIKRDGMKVRKSIRGNTISDEISQINLKIVKYGKVSLDKALGLVQEEAPKETPAEEKPAEEAPKEETKPKEEAKEESK